MNFIYVATAICCLQLTKGCPDGWLENTDTSICYKAFNNFLSQDDAIAYCASIDAYFPTMNDMGTAIFILIDVMQLNTDYWAGISDQVEEGFFTWYNGSPLEVMLIGTEEMVLNSEDDDCVVIGNNGTVATRITRCSYIYPFVCAKPKASCSSGWVEHAGSCYKAFDIHVNITEAEAKCATESALLVVIHDNETNYLLRDLSQYFLTWIGLVHKDGEFKWADNSTVDYSSWAQGEPGLDMGPCVMVDLLAEPIWFTWMCEDEIPFVCVKPKGSCMDGWFSYDNNCYKAFLSDEYQKTVQEAIAICDSYSAHLPYIRDNETNLFIANVFASSNLVWLGLNDTEGNGAHRWFDGTDVTFNNWTPGDPVEGLTCAAMGTFGIWYSFTCDFTVRFICVRPQGAVIESDVTPSTSTSSTTEATTTSTSTFTSTSTSTTTTSTYTSTPLTSTTSITSTTSSMSTTSITSTTTLPSGRCSWELECDANNRKKRSLDTFGGFKKIRRNGGIYLVPNDAPNVP